MACTILKVLSVGLMLVAVLAVAANEDDEHA
jgi:hypothetical protein